MSVFADAEDIEINCTARGACRNASITIARGSGMAAYPAGFDLGDFDEPVSRFVLNCGNIDNERGARAACLGIQVDAFEDIARQVIACSDARYACYDAELKLYTASTAAGDGIVIECGNSNIARFNRCDFKQLDVQSAGAGFVCSGQDCQFARCDVANCQAPPGPPELPDADADGQSDYYDRDDDNDGVPDGLDEAPYDSDLPLIAGGLDDDDDGLSNALELINGTDPGAVESSQVDQGISISPKFHVFGDEGTNANDCQATSMPVTYTVNNTSTEVVAIGSIDIQSASPEYAQEFALVDGADTCSEATLAADSACQFDIVYCPRGAVDEEGASAGAILQVRTDIATTPLLEAALASHEGRDEEAMRRLPPVVSELRIVDVTQGVPVDQGGLLEQTSYTLDFVVSGYHDSYAVVAVLFDCSAVPIDRCGLSFAQMIDNSGFMTPQVQESGDWTHAGVQDRNFSYQYQFTTPTVDSTSNLVLRFYQKSSDDSFAGQRSLSLMLPGNLPIDYADSSGRRALFSVANIQ